eukprot:PLAT5291.2.p1 GENE.PLAT5291.2~~PLAT5291.2.p1  ORF type:complete len:506 (+),score=116.92 PLAT5291.2:61-1578(+)
MSREEESKKDGSVAAYVRDSGEDADHAAQLIPDDAWGVTLQYCTKQDSASLATVCSWLNSIVLGKLSRLHLDCTPAAFPAARFTSLRCVSLDYFVDHESTLPVLRSCPMLCELQVDCDTAESQAAVIRNLPLFPRLASVTMDCAVVNGQLGKALADCRALQKVKLAMARYKREDERTASASDFLHQLSALSHLRCLSAIELYNKGDVTQLCAAVGAWSELEELALRSCELSAALDGVAVSIARSCPRMRKLSFSDNRHPMQRVLVEDGEAIAGMAELRQLGLAGAISVGYLPPLRTLTKLDKLALRRCRMDAVAARELAAVVQALPLTSLTLLGVTLPSDSLVALLQTIAAHRSLAVVCLSGLNRVADRADKQAVAVAFAEAVCCSPVIDWAVTRLLDLLSFLRAWNGRTPAAQLKRLELSQADSSACVDCDHSELLLRCVRSCPSLRDVHVGPMDDSLHALVAAVRAEPLTPTAVTIPVEMEVADKYKDVVDELTAAGLVLSSW